MKSARGKREACIKRSTRTMGSTMLVVFHTGLSSSLFGGGQAGSDLNLFLEGTLIGRKIDFISLTSLCFLSLQTGSPYGSFREPVCRLPLSLWFFQGAIRVQAL